MELLGIMVDSVLMRFRLPKRNVDSIGTRSMELAKKSRLALRELESLLSSFTWASIAAPFAPAHGRCKLFKSEWGGSGV